MPTMFLQVLGIWCEQDKISTLVDQSYGGNQTINKHIKMSDNKINGRI